MKSETAFTDLVPSGLLAEVQAAAAEEHHAPGELVREATEGTMDEREWRKLLAYGRERAQALGLTEADVSRLIAAVRREKCREGSPE
jgi:hypothetical protein